MNSRHMKWLDILRQAMRLGSGEYAVQWKFAREFQVGVCHFLDFEVVPRILCMRD